MTEIVEAMDNSTPVKQIVPARISPKIYKKMIKNMVDEIDNGKVLVRIYTLVYHLYIGK